MAGQDQELGTIWLDGYDINASMVDSGLAWVYRFQDEAVVPSYIKFETGAKMPLLACGQINPFKKDQML